MTERWPEVRAALVAAAMLFLYPEILIFRCFQYAVTVFTVKVKTGVFPLKTDVFHKRLHHKGPVGEGIRQ